MVEEIRASLHHPTDPYGSWFGLRETRDANIRIINCSAGISNEKIKTGLSCCIAAFSHKFIAKVVLPIDGRAATITKSEPWRPAVFC